MLNVFCPTWQRCSGRSAAREHPALAGVTNDHVSRTILGTAQLVLNL